MTTASSRRFGASVRFALALVVAAAACGMVLGSWPSFDAELMGLPMTTDGPLEIRVWEGGGIARPYFLTRIHVEKERVVVDVYAWGESLEDAAEDRRLRSFYGRHYCGNRISRAKGVFWCQVEHHELGAPEAVFAALNVDELWRLAAQDTLGDPPCVVEDGTNYGIELVQRDRRRHFVYANPDQCCPWTQCAFIVEFLKMVGGLSH